MTNPPQEPDEELTHVAFEHRSISGSAPHVSGDARVDGGAGHAHNSFARGRVAESPDARGESGAGTHVHNSQPAYVRLTSEQGDHEATRFNILAPAPTPAPSAVAFASPAFNPAFMPTSLPLLRAVSRPASLPSSRAAALAPSTVSLARSPAPSPSPGPVAAGDANALRRRRTQVRVAVFAGLAGLVAAVGVVAVVEMRRSSGKMAFEFSPLPVPSTSTSASASALASASAAASVMPVQSGGVVGVVVHAPSHVDAGVVNSNASAGSSLERAAADAVRRGDLRVAAETYEQLAEEQPQNPAFAETARILRERMTHSQ